MTREALRALVQGLHSFGIEEVTITKGKEFRDALTQNIGDYWKRDESVEGFTDLYVFEGIRFVIEAPSEEWPQEIALAAAAQLSIPFEDTFQVSDVQDSVVPDQISPAQEAPVIAEVASVVESATEAPIAAEEPQIVTPDENTDKG